VRRLDNRAAEVAADEDGAGVLDGDAGWPADHKWTQIPIRCNRMIPGHQGHIARMDRVRIKTSKAVKAELCEDSARISRDHEAHIARLVRTRIRTFRDGKVAAPVDSTGIFRAEGRVDSVKVSRVEVKDHTVRALDAGI
jgi:hypothetical protein